MIRTNCLYLAGADKCTKHAITLRSCGACDDHLLTKKAGLSEKELSHLRKNPGGRGPGDIVGLLNHIDALEELLDIADQHGIISKDGKTWRETLNDG